MGLQSNQSSHSIQQFAPASGALFVIDKEVEKMQESQVCTSPKRSGRQNRSLECYPQINNNDEKALIND